MKIHLVLGFFTAKSFIMFRKKINNLWVKHLPIYKRIPNSPYILAIWAHSPTWKDLRVTIRDKDNNWLCTLKRGDHHDPVAISKHFQPFGLNLQKIFRIKPAEDWRP